MHRTLFLLGLALIVLVGSPVSAGLELTAATPTGEAVTTADPVEIQREPRVVSLVIGNGDYRHAPPLSNTTNDARDLGARFSQLGHDVTR